MSFKNDDIDSVQHENKDESGFGSVRNLDVFSTKKYKKQIQSIISTRIGTKLIAHPIIIFSDDLYYYYLKCRSAIKTFKDKNGNEITKQKKSLTGEIKVSAAIPKYTDKPSFLTHDSFVDTTTLFRMNKVELEKVCKENNIDYAFLDGEYIKSQERLKIIESVLKNLNGKVDSKGKKEPNITYINCNLNISGTTSFNILYCPISYLEHEKKLLDEGNIEPYDFLNKKEAKEEKEAIVELESAIARKNNRFLDSMNEEPTKSDFYRLSNFFTKVLNEELQHSPSNSGNSSSASGAPQNKQHDDEADALPRQDKNKQKSS